MTYVHLQNAALQAVTLSASTASVAFSPTSFNYMTNGWLRAAVSLTSPIGLAPAFAATTQYYRGDMIIQAGKIYQAEQDFISGAAFVAANWNLLDNNTITTGNTRLYIVYARYIVSTGLTAIVLRCGPQVADTFNAGEAAGGLTAGLGNVNQLLGAGSMSDRLSADQNTQSMSKLGWFVLRNQSGSDFIPGTTALSAIYSYFVSVSVSNQD